MRSGESHPVGIKTMDSRVYTNRILGEALILGCKTIKLIIGVISLNGKAIHSHSNWLGAIIGQISQNNQIRLTHGVIFQEIINGSSNLSPIISQWIVQNLLKTIRRNFPWNKNSTIKQKGKIKRLKELRMVKTLMRDSVSFASMLSQPWWTERADIWWCANSASLITTKSIMDPWECPAHCAILLETTLSTSRLYSHDFNPIAYIY